MKELIYNTSGFLWGRRCLLVLLLAAGGCLALSLNTQINPDGILYFSYLRSLFFDLDLLFVNEFNELRLLPLSRHVSATGLEGNPIAIGTPLLMAPFYGLAFLADHLLSLVGLDVGDKGYWGLYGYVFPFGSLFYGCLTVWMILGMVKKKYGQEAAMLSLLQIGLGTPFLFYLAVQYQVSHLCSVFSVTLFIYALERIRDNTGPANQLWPFFGLGALGGLALLTRTQNGLFWILPACFLLVRLWQTKQLRPVVIQGLCFLTGALVAVSPQLMVWKILHGKWIHAPEAANISFLEPHLVETLTSPYHGLFIWSPLLIISLMGLVLLAKQDRQSGLPLLLAVILQLSVNGTMRVWWEGASFGLRLFVNCTPIFCFGLAILYTYLKSRWIRILGGIFVCWTVLLYLNVLTNRIDLNRFYPATELLELQLGQLAALFNGNFFMALGGLMRSGMGAVILTAAVVAVLMGMHRVGKSMTNWWASGRWPVFGSLSVVLTAVGISGIVWLAGLNSQHHRPAWQKELNRIQNGLNSYTRFYIDYSYYLMHADYLSKIGQAQKAAEEMEKAIRILPLPESYHRLTDLLIKSGRPKKAFGMLQKALSIWPDDPGLLGMADWFKGPKGGQGVSQVDNRRRMH